MIGTRLIGLIAVAAITACGGRKEDRSAEPVGSGSAVATSALPTPADASAPTPSAFPAVIGPPRPLDRLRPRMKEADARAALAEAGATVVQSVPDEIRLYGNPTLYATALPDTFAYLGIDAGRLVSVTVVSTNPEALRQAVQASWGPGRLTDLTFTHAYDWDASATGWTAKLQVPVQHMTASTTGTLYVIATAMPPSDEVASVDAAVFANLARGLGSSLDAAQQGPVPTLRRETADGEERAPERGATRQGFARVTTPWHDEPWNLVLRTSAANEKITAVVLTGNTFSDKRAAMWDALRAAFGEPRPVVSREGRVEIELAAQDVVVRVAEPRGDAWAITIQAR